MGDREPDCNKGREIVFVSDKDDYLGELYKVSADGGPITRLTDNQAFEDDPSWCTSKTIVFVRRPEDAAEPQWCDKNNEIYLMDKDGETCPTCAPAQRLSCDDVQQLSPSCSPDGTQIVVAERDFFPPCFTLPSQAKWISRFPICPPDPECCNPDPYCCLDPGISTLLTTVGKNENPRWSAGGQFITFASERLGPEDQNVDWEIYTMDADEGQGAFLDQLTTNNPDDDEDPDIREVILP